MATAGKSLSAMLSQSEEGLTEAEKKDRQEELPSCIKLQLNEHIKAYIERNTLLRDHIESIECNQNLIDKAILNYIIAKQILSNLAWQDKMLCNNVCTTWHSAVQSLIKENTCAEDFVIDFHPRSLSCKTHFKKSGNFSKEPLVVMTFANISAYSMTHQCKNIEPKTCHPSYKRGHCFLDVIYKHTSSPKNCMITIKSDYLSYEYMPLPPSVTSRHTITHLKSAPFIGGLYIPSIPNVQFHRIKYIKSYNNMKEDFFDVVERLSTTRIFKGIIVFVMDKYLLHTVEDIILLNHFKKVQPDIPYALGGCIVDDTMFDHTDIQGIVDSINKNKHYIKSRSVCGGGGSEGGEGRAWRVTLDHDLVETLSAIYPEWFKQPRRDRPSPSDSPPSPVTPTTPQTSDNDIFSSGAEEMASGQGSSGGSEPPSSPRLSPPKVVVDDSPLRPAMGKHKESLKVKLMMRRPINELVEQGIMPPLKTPPTYFKQLTSLNRAKTGDILKAKIQRRPAREELERRHILEQECHVDPSLAEKQRMLKKAILADQLNDQLSHRPGPLELIKKNILHTEEDIKCAVESGMLAYKATSEGASGRPHPPSSYCGPPDDVSPSPSPPAAHSPTAAQHPAPGKDKKPRCNKTKPCRPLLKFHVYKPCTQEETPYDLLLQQQQLLLQLMWPPSPAASIASDSSDLAAPPPPPLPPSGRYEDMKVPDLRAECKRRNLPVSGPKTQLIDRLRLNADVKVEPPRSPMSVASPESKADFEPSEDIVQSQSRQIRELERQLEDLRQQLVANRDAASSTAGTQSRLLLQKHLHITQLQAQIDAHERKNQSNATPAAQYVLAASATDAARDRFVRVVAVTPPGAELRVDAAAKTTNTALLLNGGEIKIVPITLVSSTPFKAEQVAPPPPPPPSPPPPMPPAPQEASLPMAEGSLNEEIEDVLEIIAKSGELPSSVTDIASNSSLDAAFQDGSDFTPSDILGEDLLNYHVGDSLTTESTQRELNAIQDDILNRAEFDALNNRCNDGPVPGIDTDLNVDLLAGNEFNSNFANHTSPEHHDNLYNILTSNCDTTPSIMDIDEDLTERMSMTPITNGDLDDHTRMGFEDMNDLPLLFHNEDSQNNGYGSTTDFDLRQFGLETMSMDNDPYDNYLNNMESIPNRFSRNNMQQSDPVMGAVLASPVPRPVHKHYSWEKIEYGDAT